MYKNGDPKKKVAKTDATSVTTSRYYPRIDQPLESSNNLFNQTLKAGAQEAIGGFVFSKAKTTIKRPKK